jgi:hypothetical protein
MGKSYFCRFDSAEFVMSIHTKPVGVVRMEFSDFPASAEFIFKLPGGGGGRENDIVAMCTYC